ncbi:hypothetical protein HanOQP8_Chr02g0045471 [Helianthus annuus]|nr:hypothetical protein HanOQP8_Chr02g0045471 [Helianthus annuus]
MFVCLVDKDDSAYNVANSCKRLCLFYFSDYVAFIVFTNLELVIVCFFLGFGKHYVTCYLLNIK